MANELNISLDCNSVEVSSRGHGCVLEIDGADRRDILSAIHDDIPIDEIISDYDTEEIVESLGIDTILDHIGHETIMDYIGFEAITEYFDQEIKLEKLGL